MKNIKFLVLGLMTVIFITGCGGKTLTCTVESEEFGMYAKYVINFDSKEEMTKANLFSEIDYGMEIPEDEDSCEEFSGIEGLTCEYKVDGTKMSIELTLDKSKLSKEDYEDLNFEGTNYTDLKKEFEDQDMTCE